MTERNDTLSFAPHAGGYCERCGQYRDELYLATLSSGGQTESMVMCGACAMRLRNRMEQRNARQAQASPAQTPVRPQQPVPMQQTPSVRFYPQTQQNPAQSVPQTNTADKPKTVKKYNKKVLIPLTAVVLIAMILVYAISMANQQPGTAQDDPDAPAASYYAEDPNDPGADSQADPVPPASAQNGIVAAAYRSSQGQLTLYMIDPQTGNRSVLSDFDISSVPGGQFLLTSLDRFTESPIGRSAISGDFRKVAGLLIDTVSNKCAGWLNADGSFTNVYEMLFGTPNAFSEAVDSDGLGFDQNGCFCFYVRNSVESAITDFADRTKYYHYYRVPMNSISVDNLEDITDSIKNSGSQKAARYLYTTFGNIDLLTQYPNDPLPYIWDKTTVSDWLDGSWFLFNENDGISTWRNGSKSAVFSSGTNRSFKDAVASPAKDQIAFLARLSPAATDPYYHLYISDLQGNNPTEVNTDLSFSFGFDIHQTYFTIIDWI